MPDKPWPSRRNPEALKAREAMGSDTPEGRAAARKLIDLTLGGQEYAEPPRRGNFGLLLDEGPEISEKGVSQLVQDMVSFLGWKHPAAGRGVAGLYTIPADRKDDILGAYTTGFGSLGVREQYKGKPRTQQELKQVILHELSHAMGTEDESGHPERIGSYDITGAAYDLRPQDINLPNENPVAAALLERQGVKRKRR